MKHSSKKNRGNALWSLLALTVALGAIPVALVSQKPKPSPEPKSDNLTPLDASPVFESTTPETTMAPPAKKQEDTHLDLPLQDREKVDVRHTFVREERGAARNDAAKPSAAARVRSEDSSPESQDGAIVKRSDELTSEELGGSATGYDVPPIGGLGGSKTGGSTGGTLGGTGGGGAGGLGGRTGPEPKRSGKPVGQLRGGPDRKIKVYPPKKEEKKSDEEQTGQGE
jgi:hypothetical protein